MVGLPGLAGPRLQDPQADQRAAQDLRQGAGQGAPHEGIGKPEALKHGLHGYWSRRITDEHRLVYIVVEDEVRIAACRSHYAP